MSRLNVTIRGTVADVAPIRNGRSGAGRPDGYAIRMLDGLGWAYWGPTPPGIGALIAAECWAKNRGDSAVLGMWGYGWTTSIGGQSSARLTQGVVQRVERSDHVAPFIVTCGGVTVYAREAPPLGAFVAAVGVPNASCGGTTRVVVERWVQQ